MAIDSKLRGATKAAQNIRDDAGAPGDQGDLGSE